MAISFVITHPEMGIYLGSFIGLGFWSKWDAAGQTMAVTFPTEEVAREYIASWEENNDPDAYTYALVDSIFDQGATVPELRAAGLGHLLGFLEVTTQQVGHG